MAQLQLCVPMAVSLDFAPSPIVLLLYANQTQTSRWFSISKIMQVSVIFLLGLLLREDLL